MKRTTEERSLRRRLLDGETLYGLVIKAPSPALVEMCAAAGFNFAFTATARLEKSPLNPNLLYSGRDNPGDPTVLPFRPKPGWRLGKAHRGATASLA
jgi:hypothetical protein